jgi:hypothetical protein
MKHRIEIITQSNPQWIKFIGDNRAISECTVFQELEVDFKKASFLEPMHIVSLSCLIELFYQKGTKVLFIPGKFSIDKYLQNIRFYEYWNPGFNRDAFTRVNIDTSFCLWKVRNIMIDSYAKEAQNYFQGTFAKEKNLESLHISLTEVFNNIFDHSGSLVDGYVITQTYPNIGKIVTSICDFGIGIPTKINNLWVEHGKDELSGEDALRAAFFRHITSKSTPRNRGFGLTTLLDIVRSLNGELIVLSNNAVFHYMQDGSIKSYPPNISFEGTLIIITLEARYLPDIEDRVEDEEFIL